MKKITVACLMLVALAPPVRAGDIRVDQAVTAYDDFEYQRAIGILEEALKKELPDTERARAWLYLGLSRFTVGNAKGAEEAFKKALEARYDIAPPSDTSPKIVELFEQVKKTVPPPKVEPQVPDVTGGGGTVIKKLPPPPPRKRVWTWVALAAGGAALAGGATFAYLASSAKEKFDKETWADQAEDMKGTIETRALTANILLGMGGAGVAAGLLLFFLEGAPAEAPQEQNVSFSLTPAGVSAMFRF